MSEHGGIRTGAGRKAGDRNKATVEREIRAEHGVQAAMETGIMPLDLLLTVMRGGPEADAISDRQFQAARDAAPYMHAKLASATLKGDRENPLEIRHSTDPVERTAELMRLYAEARGATPPGDTAA